MTNGWSGQAYDNDFGFEAVNFQKHINMFEHMEIAKNINEGVVEPSY